MQEHRFAFEIEATLEEVRSAFWPRRKRGQVMEHGDVRIEILHPGDERGEGRVRHCWFRVPRYLRRTRVEFRETYHAFNPVMRALLEKRVHRFISRDNDVLMKTAIERGVAALRKRRGAQATP